MGNTSIQTQSYRAVDKDAGQSRIMLFHSRYCAHCFFFWAVANNLNDIFYYHNSSRLFTLTNFRLA